MSGVLHGFPTRAEPEELKGALTWRMVTIAVLPVPCVVITIIQSCLQH